MELKNIREGIVKNMAIKKGIYAASMSIFNDDLSLDADSTIKHSEKLIKEGLHGAIFFGSTGCAQLISSNEKKKFQTN